MSCEEISEKLVESVRKQMAPGAALRAHMRACPECRDHWDEQENLTAHLKAMRYAAADLRSPAASREAVMARFAAQKRVHTMPGWRWALAAAAAVIISIVAVPDFMRRAVTPAVTPAASAAAADMGEPAEVQSDETAEAEGFMAVPFVPPLAIGEMLRVVHTELNPAELASLGVNVDPAWTTQLPADLLLGEDGMPRAVRVSEASDGGF